MYQLFRTLEKDPLRLTTKVKFSYITECHPIHFQRQQKQK